MPLDLCPEFELPLPVLPVLVAEVSEAELVSELLLVADEQSIDEQQLADDPADVAQNAHAPAVEPKPQVPGSFFSPETHLVSELLETS